tara:strand:+ start:181 stop:2013 length:1833 start_codon:yes stop_codon:yes gene_type:complete
MKTYSKYIIVCLFVITTGCEDYLDIQNESLELTDEDVFTSYIDYRNYLSTMYGSIREFAFFQDYGARYGSEKTAGFPICASDAIRSFDNYLFEDVWFNVAAFEETYCAEKRGHHNLPFWSQCWNAIRVANTVIQNQDMLLVPEKASQEEKDRLLGQAYFGRAFTYAWMLDIWGGMPYLEKPLDINFDDVNLPRLSYHETVMKIVTDCEKAAQYLPARYNEYSGGSYTISDQVGRYSAMHALALKSRVLLYDASEHNNPGNDMSRWQAAMIAANEALEYALSNNYGLVDKTDYSTIFYGELYTKEHIHNIFYNFHTRTVISWEHAFTWLPPTISGDFGRGHGLSVTQDMVDRYEVIVAYDAAGNPTRSISVEDAQSEGLYNDQNPYNARDPRFYQNIIYHGRPVDKPAREISMTDESQDKKQAFGLDNKTGYYVGKYWNGGTGVSGGNRTATIQGCALQRVSELYLNFAEAANEVTGTPDETPAGASFSASSAINELRQARGLPAVDAIYNNQSDFRKRVRNERYVELSFEGNHSFVDSRRWEWIDTPEYQETYKMKITEDETNNTTQYPTGYRFEKQFLEERPFYERLYLFPIPQREIDKASAFKQNPGY